MDSQRPSLSEALLVPLARSGNPLAFEQLVLRHQADAYRLALRMLGDVSAAEDVTQDAFFQAWRSLGSFRGGSSFETWLHRIVVNYCFAALRRRHRDSGLVVLDESSGSELNLERQVEIRDAVRQMDQILGELRPEQRTVFVLRHFEDWSYQRIADVTGVSVAAVRSRLHRARLQVFAAWQGAEP